MENDVPPFDVVACPQWVKSRWHNPQETVVYIYGPLYKRHLAVCAIYSQSTVHVFTKSALMEQVLQSFESLSYRETVQRNLQKQLYCT